MTDRQKSFAASIYGTTDIDNMRIRLDITLALTSKDFMSYVYTGGLVSDSLDFNRIRKHLATTDSLNRPSGQTRKGHAMRKSTTTILAALMLAASVSAQTAADIRSEVSKVGQNRKTTLTVVQQAQAINLNINPNTAPADSLDLLPGVGEKTAQAIIDYRTALTAHESWSAGVPAFEYTDDLDYVKGIGPKTVDKIRPFVSLPDAPVEDN